MVDFRPARATQTLLKKKKKKELKFYLQVEGR